MAIHYSHINTKVWAKLIINFFLIKTFFSLAKFSNLRLDWTMKREKEENAKLNE